MTVAMKGRIFYPYCDGWRIVSVAVIRDQLEEDSREISSCNGRRYIFDNSLKCPDVVNYGRVKIYWLCSTLCRIKDMFSSYRAFVEYEYSTRQV